VVTTPGQIYDVDPSRSSQIGRVDTELSGREPKPFDASVVPTVHLYLLEIDRPFEAWSVLGRTGGQVDQIRFEDLGLDRTKAGGGVPPGLREVPPQSAVHRHQRSPEGGTAAQGVSGALPLIRQGRRRART